MSVLCSRTLLVCATLLSAVWLSHSTTKDEYCNVCPNNTMCLYSDVGPACKQGQWFSGISDTDQNVIVDVHNQCRNKVAVGDEQQGSPGPQPSASNMQRLAWDSELAEVAQRWSDQCIFEHDQCRNVPRFYVGQNLYLTSSGPCDSVTNDQDWNSAVNGWYNEVVSMDKNTVSELSFSESTGHYTQVVWAETNLVGCGFTVYQEGDQCKRFYACNYGPGGNWEGQPVYKEGVPRADCPSNDADSRYPGLC